ncbi:response regulator [Paenibacillus abyssi]|uniref:Transcriptional regulatory protein LiaR n=1 Tax=Paenibacillus abyssi TaxID=1340531 RepID=A0A917D0X5_9BACL|nr:response regulator transcription factor [Paenibacillus abyssi]GGG04490.1 transcriptional regulatory protein LiaR [Paenibacillus abyssi]
MTKQPYEVPIRVMLVEDDPDWRRGLAHYISKEADLELVAESGEAEAAIRLAKQMMPDVILMDIMLADSPEGIRLTGELSESTGARIIMLTSMEDKSLMVEAFRSGAVNYLIKSDFNDIPDAVRKAAVDRSGIDAAAARQVLEEFRRLKRMEREYEVYRFKESITKTELEVLSMIDKGLTQSQIADQSFISLRTVKNHVSNILRKIGGKSSKEAAQKAKEMGLLQPEDKQ